ncbi:NAD(P)H-binding domain-containing protein [Sarocladium implicatum]|nr:NAD(P)H-binding domain-containing protein [Sarocladium implicatum]
MTQRKKIAIFGATGNIGRIFQRKLREAGNFDVRVIGREGSSTPVEPGLEVVRVDYTSQTSLVEAIRGFDVVINALAVTAGQVHHAVLDAVIEAKVPRYYPAGWGSPSPAEGRALSLLRDIPWKDTGRQIQHRVETAAIEGKLTYTVLRGGAWLESVLPVPMMFSLSQRKFFMHANPDTEFSFSSKELFAEALITILGMPEEETANRNFEVELFRTSQRRVLELLREEFPESDWDVISSDTEERYAKALEAMRSGKMGPEIHGGLLSKICLDPDVAPLPSRNDNELLGVRRATDEEVKQMLLRLPR